MLLPCFTDEGKKTLLLAPNETSQEGRSTAGTRTQEPGTEGAFYLLWAFKHHSGRARSLTKFTGITLGEVVTEGE